MMYYGYNYGYGPFNALQSILMVLFWIVILVLIISFVRRSRHWKHRNWKDESMMNKHFDEDQKSAPAILNERYAKGEIDKTEYDQKKGDILGRPGGTV